MKQEQEIFAQAMARPSGAAREEFLLGACGRNRELRRRVEELLAAFHDARELDFLKSGERSQETPTVGADPQRPEGPGTRIGRYKLLQVIGEGGMGVVYLAEQEEPVRRRVALKVIKRGMDIKAVIARFEAERQALALMDHPHIARVLDGGATETGRPYFVMELVEGVPITEFCNQNTLPAQERLKLFVPVCQAIQSAHQKGIIHRDIKPSNVLVTLHHGEPLPKVIDFGIAKATHQKLTEKTLFTQYATLIGTPAYMSPEQAEMSSKDVDTRTDVYALGVLLYELLTGTTPFPEKRLRSLGYGEMQRVILEEEPEKPSTRLSKLKETRSAMAGRGVPAEPSGVSRLIGDGSPYPSYFAIDTDLDWIVMKCLEKDRTRRYDTANGLAADLRRHLASEPVVARPPSAAYRLHKLVKKHRRSVAAAVGFVLLLTAATIVSLVLALWANRERQRAEKATEAEARHRQQAVEQEGIAIAAQQQAERNAYAADMAAANSAWRESDAGRARQLLAFYENRPKNPNDFRGFDWFFLRNATAGLELSSFEPDAGSVWGLQFEPGGQRF